MIYGGTNLGDDENLRVQGRLWGSRSKHTNACVMVDRNSAVWSFCERKTRKVVKEKKKKAEKKSLKSCKYSE